ncbi:hypothetical protein [Lentibacillus cibarius]|uniref:Uncharacterized protein n=1 Tax=Lentibacillus cibarius TaxID=2583219 RepID=A0A5S3QG08_9BACI|nr:hypothetical protein [Lentibacillus cibarius]TMN20820.1 hypothetical protein FFL34_00865 [Lentibacillus cibarius]
MINECFVVLTPGIENYIQQGVLPFTDVEHMVKTAATFATESYFIAFHANKVTTLVTDGNDHVLNELSLTIPENIWFIFDESEGSIICTGLLPHEY